MQSSKRWVKYLIAAVLAAALCAGLLVPAPSETSAPSAAEPQLHFSFTAADRTVTPPEDTPEVVLTNRGDLTLTGGSYILTGSLVGTIIVEAGDEITHLYLNNADIHSGSGPAITARSGAKLIITALPGTENVLRDSGYYPRGEENACLFAQCDLTLNGSGKLSIFGTYKDAVHGKELVRVLDADVHVQANRDGIRGNDGILISGSAVLAEGEKNSLHTTKTGKNGKGSVEVLSSQLTAIAGEYAVRSAGDVTILDSSFYENTVLGAVLAEGTVTGGEADHG